MKTYFIRHSDGLNVDEATVKNLWGGDYIAIHYPFDLKNQGGETDSCSLDPIDYSSRERHILARLKKIGKDGGYIFGVYRGYPGGKIGYIEPGTDVVLFPGKWGGKKGLDGRIAQLKVLKLKNAKNLSAFDGLSLTSVQPRQGTLCEWHKVANRVQNLVTENVRHDLDSLTPDLQEVMCMEFMRTAKASELGLPQILHTLMPVGRTLKDLDILAIDGNSNPISVQVTYLNFDSDTAKKKLKKLDDYVSEGSHTVLFCKCDAIERADRHIVFPLQIVFEEFCLKSPQGKLWFKAVI
jgi:hypothetical protein